MFELMSRRSVVTGIALAAAGAITAATGTAQAQGRMVFATQEAGTMYYTLGSGFAKMLTEKMGSRVTVQPYGGSSVYLPIINAGEAQLAFSSSLDAGAAYNGVDRKPLKKLRAVARIWALRTAFMVRASSGIKTLADLKGKRVTVDFKGQKAMGNVTRAMLFSGGLKEADVKSVTVAGVGAGSRALIEGNVDAAFIAVGIPLVKRAHSAIPGGVRYVDLSGGKIAAEDLGKTAPGVYSVKVNPAKFLPEVKEPVTVTAFDILLVTSADTPEKTVQAVLSNIAANFKGLQKAYPPLRRGTVKGFSSPTNTVPYHKGSVAYFKANGMWTDANEKKEASFK